MLTACFPWPCQPCLCCPWVGLVPFCLKLWNTHWCMLMRPTVWNKQAASFFHPFLTLPLSVLFLFFSSSSLSSIPLCLSLWDKLGPGSSKWAESHKSSIRFHRAIFAKASLDSRVMITIKRWKRVREKGRETGGKMQEIYHNVLQCLHTINLMQYLKSGFRI